jgi:hypothetical protein
MDKYLVKLRSNESHNEEPFEPKSNESNIKSQKSYKRKYSEEYLKFGFIAIEVNSKTHPLCVICLENLSNESLKPSKLKRHLETAHKEFKDKNLTFFERKRDEYLEQTKRMKRSVTVNDKALEASYHISLRIAKSKKPHTIAENLVLPSIIDTIKIFFGEEKIKEIEKIPLSDNTIKRRIDDMGIDVENQR